jgi:cysteinyl-tRNA synthetase
VYVCGITPYDTTHLGHLFTYATADILIRYLEYKYGTVTYVQNLTDLDDPILQEARKQQESWRELGNRGNLVLAQQLLDPYSSNGLRVYLARHHYRQPWEHHEQILERAERTAQLLRAAATVSGGPRTATALATDTWLPAFLACMDNDLQTPQAIEFLEQWAQAILQAHSERLNVDEAQQCLQEMSGILGLRLIDDEPEERVQHGWDAHLQRFSP